MFNKSPFIVAAFLLAISSSCNEALGDSDGDGQSDIASTFASLFNDFDESEAQAVDTTEAVESDYIEDTASAFEAGDAKLAGVVAISEVTPKSLVRIKQGFMRLNTLAAKELTKDSFAVYWIDGKGNRHLVKSSNLEIDLYQPVGGDPQFIISGVDDGLNYLVEIVVLDDSGAQTTISNLAYVPEGETRSEKIQVSPTTTVISEVVMQKVKTSYFETGGDSLSQQYIEDLSETLTVVINQAIEQASVSGDDTFSAASFAKAVEDESELDQLVAEIVTDQKIKDQVAVVEQAAVSESFEVADFSLLTPEQAQQSGRDTVETLFSQLLDDDDSSVPGYIVDFFGDRLAAGDVKTVQGVMQAIYNGLNFDNEEDAQNLSLSNALAAFSAELSDIYANLDSIKELEAEQSLTQEQQSELQTLRDAIAAVPDILMGTFPPEGQADWVTLNAESPIDVAQALTITIYIVEEYLKELVSYTRDSDGDINQESSYEFDSQQLLGLYGWQQEGFDMSPYVGVDIHHLDIRPGSYWDNVAQKNQDILSIWSCVDFISSDDSEFAINSVSVTYPKSDGSTGVAQLMQHSEQENCWNLDPWRMSEQLADDFKAEDVNGDFVDWDKVWQKLAADNKLITDFTSGNYQVTVSYNDNEGDQTESKDYYRRVIVGLQNLRPQLSAPKEEPKWPGPGASEEQKQAYNQEQYEFTVTTFENGDAIEVAWNEPDLSDLPEGVIAVYNLNIGRDVCEQDQQENGESFENCYWDEVYATWQDDIRIFGNHFVVPVALQEIGLTERAYFLNLNMDFVDENTGEVIGRGGHSHAPLRVGESLDLSGSFSLQGTVDNVPETESSSYKVALVKEHCKMNDNFIWVCQTSTLSVADIVDGQYQLDAQFSDVMQKAHDSWIDMRVFYDQDSDGQLDADPSFDKFEPMWWPQQHMHFNVWGGLLNIEREYCEEEPDGIEVADTSSNDESDMSGDEKESPNCFMQTVLALPNEVLDGANFDIAERSHTPGESDNDENKDDVDSDAHHAERSIRLTFFNESAETSQEGIKGKLELNVAVDAQFNFQLESFASEQPQDYRIIVMQLDPEYLANPHDHIEEFVTGWLVAESEETAINLADVNFVTQEYFDSYSELSNATSFNLLTANTLYAWRVEGLSNEGDNNLDSSKMVAKSNLHLFYTGDEQSFKAIEPEYNEEDLFAEPFNEIDLGLSINSSLLFDFEVADSVDAIKFSWSLPTSFEKKVSSVKFHIESEQGDLLEVVLPDNSMEFTWEDILAEVTDDSAFKLQEDEYYSWGIDINVAKSDRPKWLTGDMSAFYLGEAAVYVEQLFSGDTDNIKTNTISNETPVVISDLFDLAVEVNIDEQDLLVWQINNSDENDDNYLSLVQIDAQTNIVAGVSVDVGSTNNQLNIVELFANTEASDEEETAEFEQALESIEDNQLYAWTVEQYDDEEEVHSIIRLFFTGDEQALDTYFSK